MKSWFVVSSFVFLTPEMLIVGGNSADVCCPVK